MGPARLSALLDSGEPPEIWQELLSGSRQSALAARSGAGPATVDGWIHAARSTDLAELAHRYASLGVDVSSLWAGRYPAALAGDPEPPAVIFSHGDLDCVPRHRRVAIVGTRSCTRYGVEVARELGEQLAAVGVSVVSGLAIGIDSAAHAGALRVDTTPPIGVVGSGLDVVYPRANAGLWQQIRLKGLLVSEAPLGAKPERWRFPARNRIIAGLSELVVVVESHESGGSLSTVDEALERGVPVMAVPGSILSPASTGTNRLIADGSMPVCATADVLDALGISPTAAEGAGQRSATRSDPGPGQLDVLDAFAWQAASIELLCERTGLPHGQLALALEDLEAGGWVERRGPFYERVATPGGASGPQGPRG